MSRAFVKEDVETAEALPDRPVSEHRNFVTASGLSQIEAELAGLRERLGAVSESDDRAAAAAIARDLRYWTARHASAELIPPADGGEVRFGSKVTIERADAGRRTYRIVGEDEADPTNGTLSYVAPLARALTGREADDEVEFMGDAIRIVSVEGGG